MLRILTLLGVLISSASTASGLACSVDDAKPELYVFVSFSMPEEVLKAYGQDVDKAGGTLVIRGLIDSSFQKTTHKVSELVSKEQNNAMPMIVDPNLFKSYEVDKVPAVLIANTSTDCVTRDSSYEVIYGVTTLSYALTELSRVNDQANRFLNSLRGRAR